jgi:hypothetical protein
MMDMSIISRKTNHPVIMIVEYPNYLLWFPNDGNDGATTKSCFFWAKILFS